ncbi:MAG: prepilin-type N-terminal cleavage/methylation domain-containing protein [Pirellulaceae bacterium]
MQENRFHHVNPLEMRRHALSRRSAAGYTLMEMMIVLAIIVSVAMLSGPALLRPWRRNEIQLAAEQLCEALADARFDAIEYGTTFEFRWRPGTSEFEIVSTEPIDLSTSTNITSPATTTATADPFSANGQANSPATPLGSNQPVGREDFGKLAPPASATGEATRATDRLELDATAVSDNRRRSQSQLLDGVRFSADSVANSVESSGEGNAISDNMSDLAAMTAEKEIASATQDGQETADALLSNIPWSSPIIFYPDGTCSSGTLQLTSEDGYRVSVTIRGLTGTARVTRPERIPDNLNDTDLSVEDELPL